MRMLWPALPLALCLLVGGCGGDAAPASTPSTTPTSIAGLDSATMRVVRVAFCDLVPKTAVHAALAATPMLARSWRSGDAVRDAGGQLGHEFGCAWFGRRSVAARAWVFARPVDPRYAATLVRRAGQDRGCRASASTVFGTPSVVQTCLRADRTRRVRRAGLFGNTWLTCEVSGHLATTAVRARTDAWCVRVANALNVGPG